MRERADGNLRDRAHIAMREIRRFIEAGIDKQSFQPGDKLPTERVIAAQFRTGRNTVRKTLEALEQEGAIASEWGASENNRRARFYRLTREGRKQLQVETQDWQQTAAIIGRFFEAKAEDLS